eukprot:1862031-Ditylum_brightwellii.AAC.1
MTLSLDLEENKAILPPTEAKAPVKKSFFRVWGPALIAIVGVLAVNLALLGPTGGNVPDLTDGRLAAKAEADRRINAVLEMDINVEADLAVTKAGHR